MRGRQQQQVSMLTLKTPEALVPKNHPLREVKKPADAALEELSPMFDQMYVANGRDSKVRLSSPSVASLPQTADLLHPAEDRLDAPSDDLVQTSDHDLVATCDLERELEIDDELAPVDD